METGFFISKDASVPFHINTYVGSQEILKYTLQNFKKTLKQMIHVMKSSLYGPVSQLATMKSNW